MKIKNAISSCLVAVLFGANLPLAALSQSEQTAPSTDLGAPEQKLAEAPAPAKIRATKDDTLPLNESTNQRSGREAGANTLAIPNPILATGSDLKTDSLSPNAVALGRQLGVLEPLSKLPMLQGRASAGREEDRMDLLETRKNISVALRQAEMDVNFVLAEIFDEQGIYSELISTYTSDRDKLVAKTNMVSWGTNGILWALCEALSIPSYRHSYYAIPSGITGILAGIVPSIASAYTLKEVTGRKYSAPAAPNVFCKVFDRPTTPQIEYPDSVWSFLNSNPADNSGKTRKDLIVDRWIADSNIPTFTSRTATSQIDTICASTYQKKTLTIAVLSARLAMLGQLSSEIFKMNRLLTELEMALRGEKHA